MFINSMIPQQFHLLTSGQCHMKEYHKVIIEVHYLDMGLFILASNK